MSRLLTADTRPASVFAITNAIDRREPAAAADALRRALDEGQPVLRIMAVASRDASSDLIVARDLVEPGRAAGRDGEAPSGAVTPAWRSGSWKRRAATERRSWSAMLVGLFEADLAIKTQCHGAGAGDRGLAR